VQSIQVKYAQFSPRGLPSNMPDEAFVVTQSWLWLCRMMSVRPPASYPLRYNHGLEA